MGFRQFELYDWIASCLSCDNSLLLCQGCLSPLDRKGGNYTCSASGKDPRRCVPVPEAASPCSEEEAMSYAASAGLPEYEARRWWGHNRIRGWMIKGEPMRDWKRSLRGWCERAGG
jgi:hypothetical protein